MALKTTKWDVMDHLKTEEQISAFLLAAAEENDPEYMIRALGLAARARGMSQVAADTSLTREGLYKALSPDGNPSFYTIVKVADALGMQLIMHAKEQHKRSDQKAKKMLRQILGHGPARPAVKA